MQIKIYNKRRWSMVYLLAGVLFSFRGCFQRHISFEARQESDQLLMFYNTLSSHQQATLLDVGQSFSGEQQERLTSMLGGLSSEDLKMLKEMLVQIQGPSTQTAGETGLLKIMIIALLKVNYNSDELKDLLESLHQENLDNPKVKEYLIVLAELAEEHRVKTERSTATEPLSHAEQERIKEKWNTKFSELRLDNRLIHELKTVLKRQNDQKPLFALLDHAGKDLQVYFLTTLDELKTEEEQDNLLEVILYVKKKNPKLAEKICEGVPMKFKDVIWSMDWFVVRRFSLLHKFYQELKRKKELQEPGRGLEEEPRQKKPSSGGGLLNSFMQMFSSNT